MGTGPTDNFVSEFRPDIARGIHIGVISFSKIIKDRPIGHAFARTSQGPVRFS
jgi:hypothetical protein